MKVIISKNPVCTMEFVKIPKGTFTLGLHKDRNGQPNREVHFKNDYWIGKYPVTQYQYMSVIGSNPSQFKGDTNPVEYVSWEDVQEFLIKLNKSINSHIFRLPSEAEWEYACCAGTEIVSFFENNDELLKEYAWYNEEHTPFDNIVSTHSVGQLKSNDWGLYDMFGNVYEWCADNWISSYTGHPKGYAKLVFGGAYSSNSYKCYHAYIGKQPAIKTKIVGFRLVLEVKSCIT